jgi:hypothetical protein
MSGTALDIVTGALLNINSYSPGETLGSSDATVGLNALNDLLDSLSNDEAFVFTKQEYLFSWLQGQFQYSVGNPTAPNTFTGTITGGSPIITGVTVPSDLVAASIGGSTITALSGVVTAGTALTPVPVTVISSTPTTITLSAPATATPAINPDTLTYTVPGNIPIARPLRFRSGFTRSVTSSNSNLDYTFTFTDFDNYKRELLKNIQGPWPYIAAYQPNFPYGTVYVYPAPGSNYVAHIFADIILSQFASTSAIYSLPQGYKRALIKLLGLELAPIYGKTPSPELRLQAKEAKALIMSTNASPVPVLQFDTAIVRTQSNDASWAQHGGFL